MYDREHRVVLEEMIEKGILSKRVVGLIIDSWVDRGSYPYRMLNPQIPARRQTIQDILDIYFGTCIR